MMPAARIAVLAVLPLVYVTSITAQMPPDPRPRIAAQKEALAKLSMLDGAWRGQAVETQRTGKHTFTQTERVGPFLDGAVKVIEGRAYDPDGTVPFNAFAVISYDPDTKAYSMRTYAQGRMADVPLTVTQEGFAWELAAGGMTIRYTATVKNGTWHEVGDRIRPGAEPVRFFEMTVTRVGDTDWPAAGAVSPR